MSLSLSVSSNKHTLRFALQLLQLSLINNYIVYDGDLLNPPNIIILAVTWFCKVLQFIVSPDFMRGATPDSLCTASTYSATAF